MSQVRGQLDLTGINTLQYVSTRKPRGGKKFQITPGPTVVENPPMCTAKTIMAFLLFLVVLTLGISFANNTSTSTFVKSEPYTQLKENLRKIIRMKCTHDSSTHCTTKYEHGEYVVNIKNCVVYDFNGIPFTDVFRDQQQNWHVPPSNDMTLIVNKACKDITATYDTEKKYKTTYAMKNAKGLKIKKVVWIPTTNCYTEFDLIIGKQNILEGTPSSMISQKKVNTVVAYIYEVKGDIKGGISVSGKGCDVPIQVYSEQI